MTLRTPQDDHPRVLITAGPTWEPIDEVRFLGNRSSGRLGSEIARAASGRSLPTTLLLGPGVTADLPSHLVVQRFHTTADLESHLGDFWPEHDILIMAAAVSDYRPAQPLTGRKMPRRQESFDLRLESTPDLLAGLASLDHPGTRIGFALEADADLEGRARRKLASKDLHAIVANPLPTMDSDSIDGMFVPRDGPARRPPGGSIPKSRFAAWLVEQALELHAIRSGG